MAVVREDVVKVTYDVDSKPLEQVDDSINKLVSNTQKMAGDSGVGSMTKGFESLTKAAKEFANTKLNAVKTSLQETKQKLTEGEKGAKGLLNAVKNIAKTSLTRVVDGVKKLTTGLGKALSAAGKLALKLGGLTLKGLAAGVGAAAAGLVALGTNAIMAYADYEQLVGGVDTLFKDSSKTVQKYAEDAYKTVGLSANDYMQTVTGFSASLLQSLGGDTEKAANQAHKAVQDMSDNANKMGTDMSLIQNAYQGFAKQNYTMLDNLKLGYGGTKEEMQRLLDDAGKLAGQKFDISSYSDVIEAIHVIQENMGIAGTTANEAAHTITGSMNAMKGAWKNFMAGLANENTDLGQLTTNLVDSVVTFGKNLLPRIKIMLPRLVQGITELAKAVAAELPGILNDMLPALADGAIGLVDALVTTLSDNTQMLASTATTVIMKLAQFFLQSVPQIMVVGLQLLATLAASIAQQLPTLVPMAVQAIMTLVNGLIGCMDQLVVCALQLIDGLCNGLIANLPLIFTAALQLLQGIITSLLNNIGLIINAAMVLVSSLTNGLLQNLPMVIQAALSLVMALFQGLLNNLNLIIQGALMLVTALLQGIVQNLPAIIKAGVQLIVAITVGLIQAIPQLIAMIPEIFKGVMDAILSINWLQVGWDIVKSIGGGLWDGIKGLFKDGESAGAAAGEGVASGFQASSQLATNEMSSFATSTTQYGADAANNLATGLTTNGVAITDAATITMGDTNLAMQTGMDTINSTIGATDLSSSGVSVMQGLNAGMESMIPTLVATARRAAAAIKSATDSALDIHSPSRVMEESGINTGLGQVKGLRSTIPEMQIAAREVSNASIPYDTYSPESGSTYYNGDSRSYTTVSPQFNLTISGSQDDRALARRVKRYVSEAITETFESLERKSYSLREV